MVDDLSSINRSKVSATFVNDRSIAANILEREKAVLYFPFLLVLCLVGVNAETIQGPAHQTAMSKGLCSVSNSD